MTVNPRQICIVSDLDGTLLPPDKIPLARDIAAIRRFEAAGGRFSIATGRTIQAAVRYQEELALQNPMIVYNGAAIYDTRKKSVLFSQPLTTAARCYTAEIMAEHPYVGVEVLRSENAYVVRNTEYEKRHIALCGVTPCYCTLDEVPEGDWLKVLFAMAPDKIPDFVKSMGQKGYTDVDFVQSADIFYEMLPHGVTKGSALEAYRHLSGMENVLFIAAGDYDNDIDMLRAADFSAVPANGVPGAKTAADAVLKRTCEEGAMEELIDGIMNGVFPLQKP